MLTGQLDKLYPNLEEDNLESILNSTSANMKQDWIWIKEEIDGLTLDQLKKLILERIWGESVKDFLEDETQKKLNNFHISVSDSEYYVQRALN